MTDHPEYIYLSFIEMGLPLSISQVKTPQEGS